MADTDSFVLLTDAEVREARSHDTLQKQKMPKNKLLPGKLKQLFKEFIYIFGYFLIDFELYKFFQNFI